MKKVYHLLSVALLGAMALTSCEEDKIVNENNGEGNETDKNLTDYSFIASIKQSAPLGRSNLQNGVYTWNKGDAVTLWNRNFGAGYDFSITFRKPSTESLPRPTSTSVPTMARTGTPHQ